MIKRITCLLFLLVLAENCYPQTILQPAAMKNDLAVLKVTWENIHPGLHRYNSKEEIDSYFKALDIKTNNPLPLRDFFILVSQLNTKLHCGHSFVSPYNSKKVIREELFSKYYLPVMFKVLDGKFIITNNLTGNKELEAGVEITSINTIPVKRIIDSLLTVSKADGKNGFNKQLDNITIHTKDIGLKQYCLFDIYFPLFFKQNINDSLYQITVKKEKTENTLQVKGLSKEQREQSYIAKYGHVIDKSEARLNHQ